MSITCCAMEPQLYACGSLPARVHTNVRPMSYFVVMSVFVWLCACVSRSILMIESSSRCADGTLRACARAYVPACILACRLACVRPHTCAQFRRCAHVHVCVCKTVRACVHVAAYLQAVSADTKERRQCHVQLRQRSHYCGKF